MLTLQGSPRWIETFFFPFWATLSLLMLPALFLMVELIGPAFGMEMHPEERRWNATLVDRLIGILTAVLLYLGIWKILDLTGLNFFTE